MNHENLTNLILRRKRQDALFNCLGLACTLIGLVLLVILLGDLLLDAVGLLSHYQRDIPVVSEDAYEVKPVIEDGVLAEGTLKLTLESRTFTTTVTEQQYVLLVQNKPTTVELRGNELVIPLPKREEVTFELSVEDRRFLTRDVNIAVKTWQVMGTFMTSYPSRNPAQAGILSAWVGTLLVMLVTAFTAVPLGVAAGIYLEEYARKTWMTSLIEINISNLAGVPSILYGLMALGLLLYQFNFDRLGLVAGADTEGWPLGPKGSIAAAGVTLAMLILPIVIVATRESLRSIPQSIREAATALGATRWQVVRYHLLPYSSGGIATGVIIGLSRAIGETAPLVTIGALTFIAFLPPVSLEFLTSPFTVLPIQMFNWVSRPGHEFRVNAAAAGIVLMVFTLSLNAVAIYIRYRLRRSIKW